MFTCAFQSDKIVFQISKIIENLKGVRLHILFGIKLQALVHRLQIAYGNVLSTALHLFYLIVNLFSNVLGLLIVNYILSLSNII